MVQLNNYLCKGCGYCVKFCPKQVLEMGTQRNKKGFFYPEAADESKCISCGICTSMCPEGALELPAKGE